MAIRWSAWSLTLSLFAGGVDAFAAEFRILHSESIGIRGEDLERSSAARNAPTDVTLSFQAYGRQFDLALEPNERLLSRLPATQRSALQQFPMYRGRIEGIADSWVRITRVGPELHGMLWDGSELYIIEPAQSAAAFMVAPVTGAGSTNVVYRLSDTLSDLGPNFCMVLRPGDKPTALGSYDALVAELRQSTALAAVATGEMQVAIIGDFEFVTDNPANTQGVVLARMNNVDGIFSDQVGVQLTVSSVTLFNTASDPFSAATDPQVLIDEVRDYKDNAANGIRNTGVAHLMTGRNLDGSTVGIAFLESICNPRFGVSLSMGGSEISSIGATLVAAHEIGHNFGAPHDAEAGSACESTPADFLMAAQLNVNNDQFSACSLAQMQPVIDDAPASCIAPLAFSDAALSASPATLSAPVDQNFSFTVTASSAGSQAVDGVIVTINLPAAIALQSATPSAGTCSSGAGAVTCDLGSIPGGSSRNINVTARGTQVGTFTSTDSVTALNDTNAGNNAADVILTISQPSNGGGGGGGALGALGLLSLLLAGTRRAVARNQRTRLISSSSIGTGRPSA